MKRFHLFIAVSILLTVSMLASCQSSNGDQISIGYTTYHYYFEGQPVSDFTGDEVDESDIQIARNAIDNRTLSFMPSIRVTSFSSGDMFDNRTLQATDVVSFDVSAAPLLLWMENIQSNYCSGTGLASYADNTVTIQQSIVMQEVSAPINVEYSMNVTDAQALVNSLNPWQESTSSESQLGQAYMYAPDQIVVNVTVQGTSNGQSWELHCQQVMRCLVTEIFVA